MCHCYAYKTIVDFRKILEVKRYRGNTIQAYCTMLNEAEGYVSKPFRI